MKLLTREECLELLKSQNLPEGVILHSKLVAKVALHYGSRLKEKGKDINLRLLENACLLHDIAKTKAKKDDEHNIVGAEILRSMKMYEVADMVEKHTAQYLLIPGAVTTWEEKLLHYADKRAGNKIVTLEERYKYFRERYPQHLDVLNRSFPIAKRIEKEILENIGDDNDGKNIS